MSNPIKPAEPWRIRAVGVRQFNQGLRWEVQARRNDEVTVITCDTTRDGAVTDLQSEDYVGTTGDATLDVEVRECIGDVLALRSVLSSLPRVEVALHRSDRLRVARVA
jgi:hypothetical protein